MKAQIPKQDAVIHVLGLFQEQLKWLAIVWGTSERCCHIQSTCPGGNQELTSCRSLQDMPAVRSPQIWVSSLRMLWIAAAQPPEAAKLQPCHLDLPTYADQMRVLTSCRSDAGQEFQLHNEQEDLQKESLSHNRHHTKSNCRAHAVPSCWPIPTAMQVAGLKRI